MRKNQRRQTWFDSTAAVFSSGLLVALLSVVLIACGYSSTSSSSRSFQTQVPPPPARTQVQTRGKNCGTVTGLRGLEVPTDDSIGVQAESCFWRAFQLCQPATLVFLSGNIDTTFLRTFTIHNDRMRCSITDAKQFRIVPRPLSQAQVFTCAGLTKLPGALQFNACGKDGNVVLPGA
jgi:hypothetical protein